MTDQKLRNDLIRDEGYRYEAYQDSMGLWTIGIGHLLGPTKRIEKLTADEIDAFFTSDVAIAVTRLTSELPEWATLDLVRQRALINMSFNLGLRLSKFVKFLDAVGQQDWLAAGREMGNSLWATQVGQRAVRLRYMIETGKDQ